MGRRRDAAGRVTTALRSRGAAVADVLRHPDLRRLESAWGLYFLVEWSVIVAISVWAFDQGGARAVGVLALARLLPGAAALPFGSALGDRFRRHRLLGTVFLVQAAVQAALALAVATRCPPALIIVLVAAAGVAAAPLRPAQVALTPLLATSPQQLVAANVTAGTFEGAATFAGPALAGLLLTVTGPAVVLAGAAVPAVAGAVAVLSIRLPTDPSRSRHLTAGHPLGNLLAGLQTTVQDATLRLLVGSFVLQLVVRGLLTVLLVPASVQLLDAGDSGVGWLAAALGAGGVLGATFAVGLTARRRLAGPFALALVLWGAPIAVVAGTSNLLVAVAALVVVGIGNALLDVSGFTMIQRTAPDHVLARVFGVLFTVGIALGGVASIVAPVLVHHVGVRGALLVTSTILPVTVVVTAPGLRGINARAQPPPEALAAIMATPVLAPLPPTSLEKLAARAQVITVPEGTELVREGEPAFDFFILLSGSADVSARGKHARTLVSGDSFGEIGLLGGGRRTATVTTLEPSEVIVVDGEQFLRAVGDNERVATTARAVSEQRRREFRGWDPDAGPDPARDGGDGGADER